MSADSSYPRVSLHATAGRASVVRIGSARFGGGHFGRIVGAPVNVAPRRAITICASLAAHGADVLHDGTSSQADGHLRPIKRRLDLAKRLREETGLPVAVGLTDLADLEPVYKVADAIQLAAWRMQDYSLLSELGTIDKPVLLRRGSTALLDELLHAAEYILHGGNDQVLLCERGIRTFEPSYDVTIDFAAIPVLNERTHLPVLVDPSESRDPRFVAPLALAAAAAGSDGVVLELKRDPDDLLKRLAIAASVRPRPGA
jgi:3-deoxy-7-phosphoheptulonate synthase